RVGLSGSRPGVTWRRRPAVARFRGAPRAPSRARALRPAGAGRRRRRYRAAARRSVVPGRRSWSVRAKKKAPPKRSLHSTCCRDVRPPLFALHVERRSAFVKATADTFAWACPPKLSAQSRERRWAHQDSNLEQAGYEPAALTVELLAPREV